MPLTKVRNPESHGIKLRCDDDTEYTTKNGWTCVTYYGDDGECYERTERNGIVRWFRYDDD